MKYALVNGERQEAQLKLIGECPCCDSPVIPKCGRVRKPYWAHKSKQLCNSGKESETPWHRAWKDFFPKEWQEVVHVAENGQKHRADVKTDQGYAIEFQHSPIKFEERQSREDFYRTMIWIVNGIRQPKDKEKFINIWKFSTPIKNEKLEIWRLRGSFEKSPLLRDWADSNAPVFFDFGEDSLLGILPKDTPEERYVVAIDRKALIASLYPVERGRKSFKILMYDWMFAILASQPKKEMASSTQNIQHQNLNYMPRWRRRQPL